jgi:hypothetical protein
MAEERLPMYVPADYDLGEHWRNRFMQALAQHHPRVIVDLNNLVRPSYKKDNPWKLDRDESPDVSIETASAIQEWRNAHNLRTTDEDQASDWVQTRVIRTLIRWASAAFEIDPDGKPLQPRLFCFQPADPPSLPFEPENLRFRLRSSWKWKKETPTQAADRIRRRFRRQLRQWLAQVKISERKMKRTRSSQWGAKDTTHFIWLVLWQCKGFSYGSVASAARDWDQETITLLSAALAERIKLVNELDECPSDDSGESFEPALNRAVAKMKVVDLAVTRGLPWNAHDDLWTELWDSSIEQAQNTLQKLLALQAAEPGENRIGHGVTSAARALGIQLRDQGTAGRPLGRGSI